MNDKRPYLFLALGIFLVSAVAARAVNVGTAVVVTVVPNTPSNLTAVSASPTQVTLSWTDNAQGMEDGFNIERKTGAGGIYAVIGTSSSGVATYIDNTATAATTYFYRVTAFIGNLFSPYSNEASVTTQSDSGGGGGGGGSGGGGGGGGGGYYLAPAETSAIFRGIAYPMSSVTLLENGQVVAVTEAGPDAHFEVDLSGVQPGSYNFGVWAKDPAGNRSLAQTFQISVTTGATTIISGIFFPPTISADKIQVKQGDTVTFLGYTAPLSEVTLAIHSSKPIMKNFTSTGEGAWVYTLNSDDLALGSHTASAHSATGSTVSADSAYLSFTVGTENVAAPSSINGDTCASGADLNCDHKVDLIDFSIMAYWVGRMNPPVDIDLNHDGAVDLVDFSILAYYWTG